MTLKTLIFSGFIAASLTACGQASAPSGDAAKTSPPKTAQVSASAEKAAPEEKLDENMVVQLVWEDLMPEGEEAVLEQLYREFYDSLEGQIGSAQTLASAAQSQTSSEALDIAEIIEGSAEDTMEQIGTYNVEEDLNGEKIRIPGYVVPLDFSAKSEHTCLLYTSPSPRDS